VSISMPLRLALAVVASLVTMAGGNAPAGTDSVASGPVETIDVGHVRTADLSYDDALHFDMQSAVSARVNALDETSAAIAQNDADLKAAAAAAAKVKALGYDPSTSSPREIARQMMANQYGWGDAQFQCFDNIIMHESKWSVTATNPSSGAYGIPQALPGSKMATAGADWRTNPATQIKWALGYVQGRYGTPCGAWAFKSAHGWY